MVIFIKRFIYSYLSSNAVPFEANHTWIMNSWSKQLPYTRTWSPFMETVTALCMFCWDFLFERGKRDKLYIPYLNAVHAKPTTLFLRTSLKHETCCSNSAKLSLYFVPVVCHDSATKECRRKMAEAYALNKRLDGSVSDEDLKNLRRKLEEKGNPESNTSRTKQKVNWVKSQLWFFSAGKHDTTCNAHLTYKLSIRLKVSSLLYNPLKLYFTWLVFVFLDTKSYIMSY